MTKKKVMEYSLIFRYNKETKQKLETLIKELSGLYPSKAQVIRSAIHRLHNEKIIKKERKNDIL